jgi:prepilin-type N-terminal cleavage/methylation domain-containing protein
MRLAWHDGSGRHISRKGISLVELLVGIAIIAVLAGLILGAVVYVRHAGQEVARANYQDQRRLSGFKYVKPPHNLQILFIGNSLTGVGNLPGVVQALSAAGGETIHCEAYIKNGWTLQQTWDEGLVQAKIQGTSWDFVVLQEQGTTPASNPAAMLNACRSFCSLITSKKAVPMLYLPFTRQYLLSTQPTADDNVFSIARQLQCEVAPVGVAWLQALTQNPSLKLYQADQQHPTSMGAYLSACVFYSTLFNKSAEGLPGVFPIPPVPGNYVILDSHLVTNQQTLVFLQQVAWQAVRDSRPRWAAQQF